MLAWLHPFAASTSIGSYVVVGSDSGERLSLDEIGSLVSFRDTSWYVMFTLHMIVSQVGPGRGSDGEKDEGDFHSNSVVKTYKLCG